MRFKASIGSCLSRVEVGLFCFEAMAIFLPRKFEMTHPSPSHVVRKNDECEVR